MDRFMLLSEKLEGEVLQPIWVKEKAQIENMFGPESFPRYQRGKFSYRWFMAWQFTGKLRFLKTLSFYITEGLRAHREKPIDCVMTYSHMTTALCGMVLKALTGSKLVVEVVSSPERLFLNDRPHPTLRDHLMRLYSDFCLHVSLWSCDCVHLLYPAQLDSYPLLRHVPRAVFHEFVPISAVQRSVSTENPYILLVGAPWYLKGADLLIEAFRRVSKDFPQFSLKIMGHYPDGDQLRALAAKVERVEIMPARTHIETLALISGASLFVLPSRCEGLARVLVEAMAAGLPLIGSRIGGTPTLVRDGENGFVFEPNNVDDLEAKLRLLLADGELRRRMGDQGFAFATTRNSETLYTEEFARMIETTVNG
jgi:glycosyltransferase involved in cell wall biosynthesis